jgi:PqqD family protein of HPr-rel-A system
LPWRCWDGEYVVFNPASGHTHILDIASGEVLLGLMERPTNREDLCARLCAFLEVNNDADLEAAVSQILDSLEDLGLIEPAREC